MTPSNPRQCILLFIVDDTELEETELIRASFNQQLGGVTVPVVTEICIIDNEEGQQVYSGCLNEKIRLQL